jgi:hypothetical protein
MVRESTIQERSEELESEPEEAKQVMALNEPNIIMRPPATTIIEENDLNSRFVSLR